MVLGLVLVPRASASTSLHSALANGSAGFSLEGGPSTRVVGGTATANSKYPWQALLRVVGAEQTVICGGSLIHPLIVITAAHCLIDHSGNFKRDLEVSVWLGDTGLFEGNEVHEGVSFTAPSGYNPDAHPLTPFVLDFALITLDSPSSQPRILLAGPDERALWTAGRDAHISGWGSTFEGGGASDFLIEARTPIIDDGVCGQPGVNGSEFVFSVMVCAGFWRVAWTPVRAIAAVPFNRRWTGAASGSRASPVGVMVAGSRTVLASTRGSRPIQWSPSSSRACR